MAHIPDRSGGLNPQTGIRLEAVFVEALAVFALIMAYIWKWRATHSALWLLPAALIIASQIVRHERAVDLGFQMRNFEDCLRRFGPAMAILVAAMWGAGMLLGSIRPLGFGQSLQSFAVYLPWGLFQQYLINAYFLRRFESGLSRNAAAILASALFCAAHAPNWFLMLITPVTTLAGIWVYRRYRNLYFLGLAHAMIGFTLFMVAPDSLTHHLRVGPGWFTWRQPEVRSERMPARDRRAGLPMQACSRSVCRTAS